MAAIGDVMRGMGSHHLPRLMMTELAFSRSGRSLELHVSVIRRLFTDVIKPNTTKHHGAKENDGDGT